MKLCWRWFGEKKDTISLDQLKGYGITEIVTALHHIPNGRVWSVEEIKKRKEKLESKGMNWLVTESLPVSEAIKQGREERDRHIQNYILSIENLAKSGIKTICYNFMPVVDWTRTNLEYQTETGKTLSFELTDLAMFDLFVLQREGAEKDYSIEEIECARRIFEKTNDTTRITETVLRGLPGSEESYTLEKFKEELRAYNEIDKERLRENLVYFLEKIIPTVKEYGVRLAIHPDDPPFSLFGLPRIVSSKEDLRYIFNRVPNNENGLTLCTGSFGVLESNKLEDIISENNERIHFVHARNIKRTEKQSFYESGHIDGDLAMRKIIGQISYYDRERQTDTPIRPDHGLQILGEEKIHTNPGYSLFGRLKGYSELRGLIEGSKRE